MAGRRRIASGFIVGVLAGAAGELGVGSGSTFAFSGVAGSGDNWTDPPSVQPPLAQLPSA
jgi:hypothetical protein